MAEAKGVEAVERALQILDCFDTDTAEVSLADLSQRTGFYKSTILRLAVSLQRFGYIIRGDNGRFRLGPATWRLGAIYRRGFDLADIVRPELKTLSDTTGETASFYIREGNERVCLFRSEPARAIRHAIDEGTKMPLDRGASGRVLQAFSDKNADQSAQIVQDGYALSLGERDADVAAYAVPLIAKSGRLVGALSVSGLITRFTAQTAPTLLAALTESQQRLAAQMST